MTDLNQLRNQLAEAKADLTSETRAKLTGTVAEYRRQGNAGKPVIFGNHRKPQAVLLPIEVYRELLERATGAPISTPDTSAPKSSVAKPTSAKPTTEPGSSLHVGGETQRMIDEIMAKWKL